MKRSNRVVAVFVSVVLILSSFIGNGAIGAGAITTQSEIVVNPFVKVGTGGSHSLAIKSDGSLWGWGYNSSGQLGNGTTTNSLVPKKIIESGVTSVSAGAGNSTMAIKSDGSLWACGSNYFGELGDGTKTSSLVPKQIIESGVIAVSTGGNHAVAIKSDGSLWAWGYNYYGQLGDGTTTSSLVPKQIMVSGVVAISVGGYHTVALKSDGSLWTWGLNVEGQLGDGTTTNSLVPKQIISSGVTAISSQYHHVAAIKSDGSLWTWGRNSSGQLGDGMNIKSSVPKQIFSSGITSVSTGAFHTVITKSDGSIWSFGGNDYGQLGIGTTTSSLVPKQINLSGVTSILASSYYTIAVKDDGNVWCFGQNNYGQLGDGTTVNKLVPTKLPAVVKGKYAIISNESADTVNSASTGSFSLDNIPITDSNLDLAAYKMDYVKPIDATGLSKYSINTINSALKAQMSYAAYAVGATKTFWTYNFYTRTDVPITATLRSSGTYSNVWVKITDYDMSTTDANKITAEMDNNIYPKITSVFGQPSDVDANSKVDILCFDIKDGFTGSGGYYAGYFYPGDLYAYDYYNNPYTNQMEVFYIDTYPAMGISGTKDVTRCYDTIAHEFQHMINYNRNVFVENNSSGGMDIWLNEAFSEAASQVYSGHVSQSRINYYNSSSIITSGSSLLRWNSTLENYSLSYLFAEYLKEQVGIGDSVFTEIMQDTYNDYRAVEKVIKKYIDPDLTFVKFMTCFRAALLLKSATGLYGFKGNAGYDSIEQKIYTGAPTDLYGGGAVVIEADPDLGGIYVPSDKGATINYFIIDDAPIITIAPYQTTPTNNDITVTASTDIGTLSVSEYTFTENGSFDFIATNSQGVVTTETVYIDNIDKIAPVISGVTDGGNYNIAVVSFDEGTALLDGVTCLNGDYIRNGGNHDLAVTDLAGNVASISFIINSTPFRYLDGYMNWIGLGMTTDFLKANANILPYETVRIFDQNNVEKLTDETVGTGMTVKVMNGSNTDSTYAIVIYGDLSGDGDINPVDLAAMKRHLLKESLLNSAYKQAADTRNIGFVSVVDLLAIKKHILSIKLLNG